MPREEQMTTLNKLAKKHGVKPGTARHAARTKKLKATLTETPIGPVWMATERDFLNWKNNPDFHRLFGNP